MKFVLLLSALAMPAIAWLSQRQFFGPDNGTISDRYPTLLVAAGYAFAIWGLIFTLDVVFAVWQAVRRNGRADRVLALVRPAATLGFALTASWMVVFSQQLFWLSLAVIWAALGCLLYAAVRLSRHVAGPADFWLAAVPLSLHAGWLSLAVFLNTAQVVVAYRLLSTEFMLPWSLLLWAVGAMLLLWANQRLRGSVAYAAAAVWGLVGVYVEQTHAGLSGGTASGWVALGLAAVLVAQTGYLRLRRPAILAESSLAAP